MVRKMMPLVLCVMSFHSKDFKIRKDAKIFPHNKSRKKVSRVKAKLFNVFDAPKAHMAKPAFGRRMRGIPDLISMTNIEIAKTGATHL